MAKKVKRKPRTVLRTVAGKPSILSELDFMMGYNKTKSEITSLSAQLDDVTTKLETKLQEQIARLERILA